jgi:hypothetical protein
MSSKGCERKWSGLLWGVIPAFVWRVEGRPHQISQLGKLDTNGKWLILEIQSSGGITVLGNKHDNIKQTSNSNEIFSSPSQRTQCTPGSAVNMAYITHYFVQKKNCFINAVCTLNYRISRDISLISEAVLSTVEWHYIADYYNKSLTFYVWSAHIGITKGTFMVAKLQVYIFVHLGI